MKWIEWERCWFLQVYDWFWFIVMCPGTKGSISHRRIPRAYSNTFTLNWAPFDHSGTLWPCLLFWNGRSTTISLSLETHFWIRNAIYLHSAPKFSIPSKFSPSSLTNFESCVGFGIFEILIYLLDAESKLWINFF